MIDTAGHKLGYNISTLPGQNGCPVSVENTIIAVHLGGEKASFNFGRLIDDKLITNLNKWREELNGTSFNIEETKKFCPHKLIIR